MADFRPSALLAHIKSRGGLARPSRFEAIIPIPAGILSFTRLSDIESGAQPNSVSSSGATDISRSLALQCETTELPGRTLLTQDAKIYGPTFKIPYQSQYNEISLTFLCTNEFYERRIFETWIHAIMAPDTNNMRFRNTYLTTLQVVQYDDASKNIYRVSMYEAFPTGISPAPLAWAEEGFHRLTVQFAYTKYGIDNRPSTPLPEQTPARREQLGTGPE
jgi:hypothetical protein